MKTHFDIFFLKQKDTVAFMIGWVATGAAGESLNQPFPPRDYQNSREPNRISCRAVGLIQETSKNRVLIVPKIEKRIKTG